VLTHHPEDAPRAQGFTVLDCDVPEAVLIALEAADGKKVAVHSPTIGRRLLERGPLDGIHLHLAPLLLGDVIRLFDDPGGVPVRLERPDADDPVPAVHVRCRPRAVSSAPAPAGTSVGPSPTR
jgi:hypothetical protein